MMERYTPLKSRYIPESCYPQSSPLLSDQMAKDHKYLKDNQHNRNSDYSDSYGIYHALIFGKKMSGLIYMINVYSY